MGELQEFNGLAIFFFGLDCDESFFFLDALQQNSFDFGVGYNVLCARHFNGLHWFESPPLRGMCVRHHHWLQKGERTV